METPQGRRVGWHEGLMYYTIGQRKGLGIGGEGEPWYVAAKDMARNVLIVVQGHDHAMLLRHQLHAIDLSWTAGEAPAGAPRYAAKTRYRQRDAACRIATTAETGCNVEFAEPQWAITPGQSFVAYAGEVCLGGGIIA